MENMLLGGEERISVVTGESVRGLEPLDRSPSASHSDSRREAELNGRRCGGRRWRRSASPVSVFAVSRETKKQS